MSDVLHRFIEAQRATYPNVMRELHKGRKVTYFQGKLNHKTLERVAHS